MKQIGITLLTSLLLIGIINPTLSKSLSLQELVADIKKLQAQMNGKLPRSVKERNKALDTRSHSNLCLEKTITVNLQEMFKTTDRFFPPEITKVQCALGKFFGPRGYPTCNGGQHDCITKKRRVWFLRTPANHDCRFSQMQSLLVETGCECQAPIHTG